VLNKEKALQPPSARTPEVSKSNSHSYICGSVYGEVGNPGGVEDEKD